MDRPRYRGSAPRSPRLMAAQMRKHEARRSPSEKIAAFTPRPTRAELYAMGESLRNTCPRSSHGVWKVPHDRPDPVRLIKDADQGRIPELVLLRHGRMLQTPFTFYRGGGLNMTPDFSDTPVTGALFY